MTQLPAVFEVLPSAIKAQQITRNSIDDELRAAVRANASSISSELLGAPNKSLSTRRELRWGSKGALAVVVSGPKLGLWTDHSAGVGGDLFDLLERELGSFPAAIEFARHHTGLAAFEPGDEIAHARRMSAIRAQREAEQSKSSAEEAAELAGKIAKAQRIAAESVPVNGTLGEAYLNRTRAIPTPSSSLCGVLGWHAGRKALVAIATAADGSVRGGQLIHLTPDALKISQDEAAQRGIPAVKQSFGSLSGAAVRFAGDTSGPLLIGEGIETTLAAHVATGCEAWAALGIVGKLDLPRGRRIVVLSDDNPPARDAKRGQAAKAQLKAVREWRQAGLDVVVATPWGVRRYDKSDMADVILAAGPDAVRVRVQIALQPRQEAAKRVGASVARQEVAKAVQAFSKAVLDGAGEMLTHAIKATVGLGKSHAMRAAILKMLTTLRQRGDKRGVFIAVPTIALADEQAAAFAAMPEAAGLTVKVWRGRAREVDGVPMCGDLDRVADAHAVGLSVQTSACKNGSVQCPLFDGCAYQAQRKAKADVWIGAHENLFHERPETMGELAAVVIDESFWAKGLIGADGQHVTLSLDALLEDVPYLPGAGIANGLTAARLRDLRRQLHDALRTQPNGPVDDAALAGSLLNLDSIAEAISLDWQRKVENLHPGMSKQERRNAMEQGSGNKLIGRRVMAWQALRALIEHGGTSGWLSLGTEQTSSGPVRVLQLKGRRDVASGWQAPTLILDATLDVDLVRPFFPSVHVAAEVEAETPHQHIRQAVDRAYAKSMLAPLDDDAARANPAEAQRRQNRLVDLHAMIGREARRYAHGRVLVVVQLAVEEALQSMGRLPGNVDLAHHNAVAGRDEWKDVVLQIVVGRTQPPPAAVERQAEALTGHAVTPLAGWYERADASREMADGSAMPAEADRHPDTTCEAIRWQACEAGLVQVIGRARGVNRTASNPVEVMVLTDVPLPLPIAGTIDAIELTPSPTDRMMAAGGIALDNARHAAAAFPALWPSHNAADLAFRADRDARAQVRGTPIESYNRETTDLSRVSYRLAGVRQKPAVALVDLVLCLDPAAFLTHALGALASCEVETVETQQPVSIETTEPAPIVLPRYTYLAGCGVGAAAYGWLGMPKLDPDSWLGVLPPTLPSCALMAVGD